MISRRPWQPDEDAVLRAVYATTLTANIAGALGRSLSSTHQRARVLGLTKSIEWIATTARERVEANPDHGSRRTRIAPGQKPWNAGMPGSTGTQEGCRATQFKKGRHPSESRNYLPIGSLRVSADGLLERKFTDDPSLVPAQRWAPVHRLVWESANGQVPAGHLVVFKPGMHTTDIEQITVDRLECITRADNMRRNTVHRYGPEIAQLVQLRGAISRQINKRAEESREQ
jgi:hypothetical protein